MAPVRDEIAFVSISQYCLEPQQKEWKNFSPKYVYLYEDFFQSAFLLWNDFCLQKLFSLQKSLERHKTETKCGKKGQLLELEKKRINQNNEEKQKHETEIQKQFFQNLFVNLNPDDISLLRKKFNI